MWVLQRLRGHDKLLSHSTRQQERYFFGRAASACLSVWQPGIPQDCSSQRGSRITCQAPRCQPAATVVAELQAMKLNVGQQDHLAPTLCFIAETFISCM